MKMSFLCLRFLFVSLVLISSQITDAQRRLAIARPTATKITVYKLPSAKSSAVVLEKNIFFYIDSTIGGFYSFDMEHIEYDLVKGYVSKNQVQAFSNLTTVQQKNLMNQVFDKYEALDRETEKSVPYPAYFHKPASERIHAKELYYRTSLYPVLQEFPAYYKSSSDAQMLIRLFWLVPHSDGEFAEMLSMYLYKAYIQDKTKFINAFKTVKNKSVISGTKGSLIFGIKTLMPRDLASQAIDEGEVTRLVDDEVIKVERM